MNNDDKNNRTFTLIGTLFVVNLISILSGLLYQKLAKSSYHNTETNHYNQFRSSLGYCFVLKFVTWILAEFYFRRRVNKPDYVVIEKKRSIICGLIMTISTISFMQGLYLISYSFIMMAKSASVIQIVLIGVFCSWVKDQNNNLIGRGKIIYAFIVTLGVVLFKIFDPQTYFNTNSSRQRELLGFLLLMINIIVDYFYSNYQMGIQRQSNPKPAQLLAEVSKWSFIISFILSIIHGDLIYTINFIHKHPIFIVYILALAVISFIGQTLVYNMMRNIGQKLVPLVNSTRKTFTIVFNLIYFGHVISFGQIIGILIGFSVTIWQFLETLSKNSQKQIVKQQIKQNQFYEIEPQFGPFGIGKQKVGNNQQYKKIIDSSTTNNNLGSFAQEQEQCSFGSS